MGRRDVLRWGALGGIGLSLPQLLRVRAAAAAPGIQRRSSVIIVWLHGGASHLETYDPKPDSGSDFRGPYQPISTSVPGLQLCELLPHQAKLADKFSLLRSLSHSGFCHDDGPQQLFTGHPVQGRRLEPIDPDMMSIVNYLRSSPDRKVPLYVGASPIPYLGSAYLGPSFGVFAVNGDPNDAAFEVPNVGRHTAAVAPQIERRISLRKQLEHLKSEVDQGGDMDAMDRFEQQAWNMLSGEAASRAFDISQEDEKTRNAYGRNRWGQQCLLARRLVEAGVEIVTVTLNGALCGRVGNWDDHAVNHHVFDGLKYRTPFFDQGVAALIEDVHQRGLADNTLIVVAGDFGRTPKISYAASTGEGIASGATGTMQPGRDHWPHAMSFLFSGGGITPGQVIGATDARGEQTIDRRVGVQDFLSTLYRHLGIDALNVQLLNFSGRPVPILQEDTPISELLRRT
ncbi:MAG: DUF1501 domain-containing protein [Planctomycetaceae bacterium]|nr:DUF1501 domain-containing protein [Planctomycetaceae bacterium]